VGEIGKGSDLSDFKGIENVAFSAMDSKDDGVRAAGSFALGNISVGSLNKFLPTLLELVKSKHTYQYSLYASIKEALVTLTKDKARAKTFQPYVDQVVPILTQSAEAKDEGVRAMVAQCLGLLTIVDTAKVLAVLGKLLGAQAPVARAVSIIGLRFALSPLVDYSLIACESS
jgi:cullin-associated NEDD8-dissociated protein 1